MHESHAWENSEIKEKVLHLSKNLDNEKIREIFKECYESIGSASYLNRWKNTPDLFEGNHQQVSLDRRKANSWCKNVFRSDRQSYAD